MLLKVKDIPPYYNAAKLLENNLPKRSDKTAIYSATRSMSFSTLSEEVNQVGNALIDKSIRFGDCVGILLPDSPEWVASFFGIVKIGAIAVCLNTELSANEYEYIFKDSRLKMLIVHDSLLSLLNTIPQQLLKPNQLIVVGQTSEPRQLTYNELCAAYSSNLEITETHKDDFCSLHYSSGTTGQPKGMFHAHKDYLYIAENTGVNFLELTAQDCTFSMAKLFFVYGLGANLVMPFHVGASIILYSGSTRTGIGILETIQKFKPTILISVPTAYVSCLALGGIFTQFDLSSLKRCLSAGEVLPAPVWQQWKEKTGLIIQDTIGCTETFHTFMANRLDDLRPGSSGKPSPGYEVKIVDANGIKVPIGIVGNLMVKGGSTVLFYLHQYEKSRQTFQGEWLLTGDKYYQDKDGFYWYVGRTDDMFKVGGKWVSPIEIEQAIINHPKVQDCAVIGQEDKQQLVKPKAYVCLVPNQDASSELLKALIVHCSKQLTTYKCPRWFEFTEKLPRTSTGKLQRFKLKENEQQKSL